MRRMETTDGSKVGATRERVRTDGGAASNRLAGRTASRGLSGCCGRRRGRGGRHGGCRRASGLGECRGTRAKQAAAAGVLTRVPNVGHGLHDGLGDETARAVLPEESVPLLVGLAAGVTTRAGAQINRVSERPGRFACGAPTFPWPRSSNPARRCWSRHRSTSTTGTVRVSTAAHTTRG
jgi:hypothetical protein